MENSGEDHLVFEKEPRGDHSSPIEYKGRTIQNVRGGGGGSEILQNLMEGSCKFFCDKTETLQPIPPPS